MSVRRRTVQKTAVENAFRDVARPLTPQEAWEIARVSTPSIGIATVYRAIKVMLENDELHRVEVPGEPPRYELASSTHHHHFHCRGCGRVFPVDGCAGDLSGLLPRGFKLEDHTIVLHGRCSDCAKSARGSAAAGSR